MTIDDSEFNLELSRRRLLAAAGFAGSVAVAAAVIGSGDASAAPAALPAANPLTTPPVAGLHLQFGADASSEVVVTWHTMQAVNNPRVMLGMPDGKLNRIIEAKKSRSYIDAKSGQVVYAYHAKIGQLQANASYLYGAIHDGAAAEFGTFRTAPRGRSKFTFTSFGDQNVIPTKRPAVRRGPLGVGVRASSVRDAPRHSIANCEGVNYSNAKSVVIRRR